MFMRLLARTKGRQVGTDRFGNAYYESRDDYMNYGRKRRWVLYAGAPDPTTVPPEWHGWLHHTADAPLPRRRRHPWMVEPPAQPDRHRQCLASAGA